MRCRFAAAIIAITVSAAAAYAEDLKVVSAAVLYESGLAAPVVELRSVAEDGSLWRGGINGWAISLERERPIERGRRLLFGITATPYDAHSSRRVYRNGTRARDLEFDDAALAIRAGLRIRQGEHATIESLLVAGEERIGSNAPQALRNDWRSPYAGAQVTETFRFVTADDPFISRIDDVEVVATAEAYRGNRTWTKGMVAENAGLPLGRIHLRQSFAAFDGSGLDTVNAFLVGGSWDALGALALYGTPYAELRLRKGVSLNGGADFSVNRSLDLGVRAGVVRADATRTTGAMLMATGHLAGFRLIAGAGRSRHRTMVTLTLAGAMFR
jgi:hypothetical protein